MDSEFNAGDIVLSNAGRDSGRHYIIMETKDNFAFICDGDLHKTDKPKKKKFKHLKIVMKNCDYISEKISEGTKVTNAELRRAIAEFEAQL